MQKIISVVLTLLSSSALNAYYYNQYNQYNQVPPIAEPRDSSRNIPLYPNQAPKDIEISEKVEALFKDDPNLSSYAAMIEIYTLNGEVTLAGVVDSERIKLRAESKARNVLGVRRVINQISTEKTKSTNIIY